MTFTIVARDPVGGHLGVATASRSLAVGRPVPAITPGLGAVASQAYTNSVLRGRVLQSLRAGLDATEAVRALESVDGGFDQRQVLVVDASGRAAVHTGSGCSEWAGSLVGDGFVVAGNLLAGEAVVAAMADAFVSSGDDHSIPGFGERLLAALTAGEAAGGDRRGKQSAALLIADGALGEAADGAPRVDEFDAVWSALAVDLRVDDHVEPVDELVRLARLRFERFTVRTV